MSWSGSGVDLAGASCVAWRRGDPVHSDAIDAIKRSRGDGSAGMGCGLDMAGASCVCLAKSGAVYTPMRGKSSRGDGKGVEGKGDKDEERIGEDGSGRETRLDETSRCAAKRATALIPTDSGAAADTSQSRQRRGRTALQGQHQGVRAESQGGSCVGSGVVDRSSVYGLRCPFPVSGCTVCKVAQRRGQKNDADRL